MGLPSIAVKGLKLTQRPFWYVTKRMIRRFVNGVQPQWPPALGYRDTNPNFLNEWTRFSVFFFSFFQCLSKSHVITINNQPDFLQSGQILTIIRCLWRFWGYFWWHVSTYGNNSISGSKSKSTEMFCVVSCRRCSPSMRLSPRSRLPSRPSPPA